MKKVYVTNLKYFTHFLQSHHTMSTTSELKTFAARLGALTSRKQALSTRTFLSNNLRIMIDQKVYEKILEIASLPHVGRRWKLEETITLQGIDSSSFMEQIDELLAIGLPYTIPLKLVCLYSIAHGGLKQKYYDQFRRDFCHVSFNLFNTSRLMDRNSFLHFNAWKRWVF